MRETRKCSEILQLLPNCYSSALLPRSVRFYHNNLIHTLVFRRKTSLSMSTMSSSRTFHMPETQQDGFTIVKKAARNQQDQSCLWKVIKGAIAQKKYRTSMSRTECQTQPHSTLLKCVRGRRNVQEKFAPTMRLWIIGIFNTVFVWKILSFRLNTKSIKRS